MTGCHSLQVHLVRFSISGKEVPPYEPWAVVGVGGLGGDQTQVHDGQFVPMVVIVLESGGWQGAHGGGRHSVQPHKGHCAPAGVE